MALLAVKIIPPHTVDVIQADAKYHGVLLAIILLLQLLRGGLLQLALIP